ncbi:MAG: formate dehydrogenase-N subunit alpha [Candidatus Anoxymicrobium japonicum]|uniref:Formate dehydrogenase-N subunit alpha n=1 Tax=Candidatus Anoxymicrobium japonicum TaxID=2013648 RepID=A0A2N3G7Q6_9ACTN|nr:MAG: formate dehydrogenase-N subunit alpha [Candidatus Anoxymicrobium japonicum]
MELTRRDFLKLSGAGIGTAALANLGFSVPALAATEPLRISTGKESTTICPYCGTGCGILVRSEKGKIINTEGNPDHPINTGTLCSKGTSLIQVGFVDGKPNKKRLTKPLYRAPGSSSWKEISWEDAITRIARKVKETRDNNWILEDEILDKEGKPTGKKVKCNRTEAIANFGGASLDNEECYLLTKFARSLGIAYLEHQARICHSPSVPGLAGSFGRGAMTNHFIDLKNSDCFLACGSNTSETHPLAFKWMNEAMHREKDPAKLIVVDPRFTRTASKADIYSAIRPGTDIAFCGGIINYAIENNTIDWDYVKVYTNFSFLVNPGYKFNEETGLFSGYNEEKRKYDPVTWSYQMDKIGPDGKPLPDAVPLKDPTFQNPQCVFQLLKKHYSRYTPEMVEKICGISKAKFDEISKTYCATHERGKSGVHLYAMGLTHHTCGTQNIRSFAILQLLLGNIGVPGGGIAALRGESNVQGSTDHALLWHILPGYLAVPNSTTLPDLKTHNETRVKSAGTAFWKNGPKFTVSLLKAFWGDNAKPENEFGYQWLPKVKDGKNYSHIAIFEALYKKEVKGMFCWGQNPCVGGPNSNMEGKALENLDWLVAVDLWETETSAFWKRPDADAGKIDTEVFFLPAASSVEKEGTISNSGRWMQWRYKAVDPPGLARPDAAIISQVMLKLRELYVADKKAPNREAIVNLYWPYGEEPDPNVVLKEINGFTWADKKQVLNFTALKDDGSTACGCWVYSGVYPTEDVYPLTGGNLSKRAENVDPSGLGLFPKWTFAWPVNRRILYNRCSADPAGQPWNKDKNLVQWDGAKWVNNDVADFAFVDATKPDKPPVPPAVSAANPYIMLNFGMGHLFAPGSAFTDGPFPEHYEPVEAPCENSMSKSQNNPVIKIWDSDMDKLAEVGDKNYPIVCMTFRLTEHWQAGQMTRNLPWLAELQPEMLVEMSKDLAKRKGISNGTRVKVKSVRGEVGAVALVTDRVQPMTINGVKTDVVGIPWHFGYTGYSTGGPNGNNYAANQLTPHVGDANTMIPEYKAFLVNIEKA